MRRIIEILSKFALDARLRNTTATRFAIILLSVTVCGPVYSQFDGIIRKAQQGLQGPGPPGTFRVPRPRAGNKPQPAGYKLFEKKEMEWIGKEYLDTIRGSSGLANGYLSLNVGTSGYLDEEWKVHMILDDREALLVRGWDKPALKISGYDFSRKTDGESLHGDSYFRVMGTDNYTDVQGQSISVYLAEPLSTADPPPKPASVATFPYQRPWTNATNGRIITATYYRFDKGTVSLLTSTNEVIEVPLEELSTEDKSHVSKLMRIRRDVADYNQWARWQRPQYLVQKILN